MREIETKADAEKKASRKKIILGTILAALMLLSTAGYALLNKSSNEASSSGNEEVIDFKGMKFEAQPGGLWKFEINGQPFYTSYTPRDVEDIKAPYVSLQNLANEPLYYSGNSLAVSEIIGNIQPYIVRAQEACYSDLNSTNITNSSSPNCDKNLPIKDCSNNFIVIRELNETEKPRISIKGKCMFVDSSEGDVLKTSDALLFRILGIN